MKSTVPTPIGAYYPDWAIVMESSGECDSLLYLVRETKGTLDLDALRPDEKRKIPCGRRHFRDTLELGHPGYRVITDARQVADEPSILQGIRGSPPLTAEGGSRGSGVGDTEMEPVADPQ